MLGRKILAADITRASAADTTRSSSLTDFPTGPFRRRLDPRGRAAFPCLIDIARGRTLYVPDLDAQRLREAPFANVYARTEAKSVLSVPWEAGPINRRAIGADPLYIFSSGRCGSTLLHNILLAAGVNGVSEPDIATALISPVYSKYPLLRPLLRWATRTYVRDLVSALDDGRGPLVIKLRSQFCGAAEPLLKSSRERRTIFMTRDFASWSRSAGQLFRVSPAYLIQEYRRSLKCYVYLRQASHCHFLRYEDLVADPGREMARLSEFLGHEITGRAIDEAMAVGSQKGTGLEKISEKGLARWQAMKDEVDHLWTASGTAELYAAILQLGEVSPPRP
jgi:hypothetical protein